MGRRVTVFTSRKTRIQIGSNMATLTIRLDDQTRDDLQAAAHSEGQTLSEFVRARLEDAVHDFGGQSSDVPKTAMETLSTRDRHMLALLHRILGRVLPEDANGTDGDKDYQLERAEVLESGFTTEYWAEFAGLQPELSMKDGKFVMDVLDMFRVTRYSIDRLDTEEETPLQDSTRDALDFRGFDRNDELERQMADYVAYLVTDDRWTEQKDYVLGPRRGNSHRKMIPIYSRMLSRYRMVRETRGRSGGIGSSLLSSDELEQIAAAVSHPPLG